MNFQWLRLLILTWLHAVIDMHGGFLPTVLPAIRGRFELSLTAGVGLLAVLNITHNVLPLATGPMRARKERPFFIPLAFLFVSLVCFMFLIPVNSISLVFLVVVTFVCGAGGAVFHPEAMRAIHTLGRITSSVRTPFWMMGGFIGASSGALIGAMLVEQWGLKGLLLFVPLGAFCVLLVYVAGIRLQVDVIDANAIITARHRVPFWPLFFMALPLATGTTIITSLLPSHLEMLGHKLSVGGWSAFLFGAGMGIGGVCWGMIAAKMGELTTAIVSILIGLPFITLFIMLSGSLGALPFLIFAGFSIGGGYPMLVSLARQSTGMNLGRRMALMIGGVWGTAGIILMFLAPLADYLEQQYGNLTLMLYVAVACYPLAGLFGLYIRNTRYFPETDPTLESADFKPLKTEI